MAPGHQTLMLPPTLWKRAGRPFRGKTVRISPQERFPASVFPSSTALPLATSSSSLRTKPATPSRPPPLFSLHKIFTHGGSFWRDTYLLERWASSEQPVVYLGDVLDKNNLNFELKLRLGDWCWLTQDTISKYA